MLETELKALLTKYQYQTLLTMFDYTKEVTQTNSYYISPDNALKSQGITFRIRTIGDIHTAQIKKHINKQGGLQVSEEREFKIDDIPPEFTEEEVYLYTGIKTTASLIGELTTLRMSCMFCDGVEICLDKSTYLGKTDYEIEVEYTSPVPDKLINELGKIDITFNSPTPGKYSRFLSRLLG